MNDVECPYCGAEQEICHDDGYGYEEGIAHQQECGDCCMTFVFLTSIRFYYRVEKADCLNGGEHKMNLVHHSNKDKFPNWTRCEICGEDDMGKPLPYEEELPNSAMDPSRKKRNTDETPDNR
jgi:hypothetical protein